MNFLLVELIYLFEPYTTAGRQRMVTEFVNIFTTAGADGGSVPDVIHNVEIDGSHMSFRRELISLGKDLAKKKIR